MDRVVLSVSGADVPRGTDDLVGRLFGARTPLIQRYAELLATSGVERGLIGPREVPRLWDRHIFNCAVIEELVPASASVADVGSGAGLPGLVLAIARPDLRVSLVEPLLRRTTWLGEVIAELELDKVEVVRGRAEQVAQSGARFDVVTARAVAALPALAEFCLPLVAGGGLLLAMKGESAEQELADAEDVLAAAGVVASGIRRCGTGVLAAPTTVVELQLGLMMLAAARPGAGRSADGRASTGSRAGSSKSAGRGAAGRGTAGRGSTGSHEKGAKDVGPKPRPRP